MVDEVSTEGSDAVSSVVLTPDQSRVIQIETQIATLNVEREALEARNRASTAVAGIQIYEATVGGELHQYVVPDTATLISAHTIGAVDVATLGVPGLQTVRELIVRATTASHAILKAIEDRITELNTTG